MPSNKLVKKIIKDITESEKILSDTTIKDFNKLTKEETLESILRLIEGEEDSGVKRRLIEIYDSCQWIHDKNLLLLSIWNSYND